MSAFFDEENAPEAKTADGNPVNGFYDSEKKEFWIDRTDPDMNPLETLGHEFYHANDKMFGQFNELINSGINEAGKKTLSATEDDYAKAGMPGAGLTEFNADTFGKMWTDPAVLAGCNRTCRKDGCLVWGRKCSMLCKSLSRRYGQS